jgi:organic radical activating enzyme
MTQKIFPINVEPACLSKWNWSTVIFNSGSSASCHRTQRYTIDPNNFDAFHNLPEKLQARESMLSGHWPGAGCEYCKTVEQHGGVSDRKFNLSQLTNPALVPPELYTNATATTVTPTILEVYFKNTCNMACVYCGPHHSSKWEDENRRFQKELLAEIDIPYSVHQAQNNIHYDKMVADFWQWLAKDNHYKIIQRYHVLGGEPFLLKELDDSIDFWNKHGNPDLVFSVITNLNIPHERFKSYIKQFEKLVLSNKIWKLQLTASLDCWGPVQEHVRWGLDLSLWQKNFELLINRPWVELSINSVLSALTIKQLPLLLEKINVWNQQQTAVAGRWRAEPILHSFNASTGDIDSLFNFSGKMFEQDFDRVLELMPVDNQQQQGHHSYIQGFAKKSQQSTNNVAKIERLKDYLDELDVRRKTNWRDHFPWLNQNFSVQCHNDSN